MKSAQVTISAPTAEQESRTAETAPPDARLSTADKLVVISFLISLALFGLISVMDLLANLFR